MQPNQHRRNAAERAICTFKNHLLSGLATCDPDFPLREWDQLLFKAELTLNLLRNARLNPKLSSWDFLFGNHDFNRCLLLPPGKKVILHVKAGKRASLAFYGEQGWYIGPATNHYRCITCYIPKTHREIIADTATIIPRHISIPHASLEKHLRQTADDIVHLLHSKQSTLFPGAHNSTKNALINIAELLKRDETPFITPISQSTATSERIASSEGAISSALQNTTSPSVLYSEGAVSEDIFKTTITPFILSTEKLHPSLYQSRQAPI